MIESLLKLQSRAFFFLSSFRLINVTLFVEYLNWWTDFRIEFQILLSAYSSLLLIRFSEFSQLFWYFIRCVSFYFNEIHKSFSSNMAGWWIDESCRIIHNYYSIDSSRFCTGSETCSYARACHAVLWIEVEGIIWSASSLIHFVMLQFFQNSVWSANEWSRLNLATLREYDE